jgi:hypothetical protein
MKPLTLILPSDIDWEVVEEVYKIVDLAKDGKTLKTLFHGVDGSKTLPMRIWIKSEKKWAGEGGSKYWTGFHVIKDIDKCREYLKRFTDKSKRRVIVSCLAKNLRPKESSRGDVFLAEEIMIL